MGAQYVGRFAPSPTGPLHAGSLVAALASWLDARAHGGQWLVRIEDIDTPRCVAGADALILKQLAACGLLSDAPPLYQSRRGAVYQAAIDGLIARQRAYPCGCTRQDIAQALADAGQPKSRHGELVYPGTCRQGLRGRPTRAWRFFTGNNVSNKSSAHIRHGEKAIDFVANDGMGWQDRRLGSQQQDVARAVGDFVLQRADRLWAYQLAVVVDDGAQGISDVVRGQDLLDNTARQILLQRALGLPTPRYLHVPLVMAVDGEKLSKQNGAQPLDTSKPLASLVAAAQVLGLQVAAEGELADWLAQAVLQWAALYPPSVSTRP
ncbi:tRNA glutamyl-Q(34) synthetase GluQRS [Polaromonas eurypsychrophila]|uniref:Glutamyl-Q tRNA(Asp) synthetase n=1 Tax=Polaromonas eurypsychrophila TaxID=1614635 RepID=A0A916WIT1_9BURK|nr:tRNA glutamyl-Q(34) synthetase GluQRS [Polaromonas eurypsychrophila]GGB05175.1 glutamyl-Q tRNA(Asp) synthetase [Polaromonas eurypsychrophila]